MTGKARVQAAFRGEPTDRTPWIPFAGIHAGRLAGYSARQVLTDPDALVASLAEVNRMYHPDGQPVMFDLQLEAEALGCPLLWAEDAPPTVCAHPLASDPDRKFPVPGPQDGRLGLCLEAMRRMKREFGETTALFGLLTGPFTLASHLRGTDIFMDLVLEPARAAELLSFCLEVSSAVAGYYAGAGMDVIAAVDPMVSQIGPEHFTEFLAPVYSALFARIRGLGALSSFFVCGNATRNIEVMCLTKPDGISVDENVDLVAAKAVTDAHAVAIGGNLPLTTVMLMGSQADNARVALDLIDRAGGRRFMLSPGCDMPYGTPPENVVAAEQAAHNPGLARRVAAAASPGGDAFDIPVAIPDYAAMRRPLVEVFTLDSASCAACTYMLAAARDMEREYPGRIDVVEYKYTLRENVARCRAMGVRNLPSIYIDGKLAWSSIIPPKQEFRKAVDAALGARKD